MSSNHTENYNRYVANTGELRKDCPDVMEAFTQLHRAAFKDDVLSKKTKELIAIGISISIRCKDCIDAHIKAAIRFGATREEISEAIGVAILMSGGPGTSYASFATEAMNEFFQE